MIQHIEKVRSELHTLGFTEEKLLEDKKIHVALEWSAQYVAPNVANIRSPVWGYGGRIMGTRDRLFGCTVGSANAKGLK